MSPGTRPFWAGAVILILAFMTQDARAQADSVYFSIRAGAASDTLMEFSRQADVSVVFASDQVREWMTRPIEGQLAIPEALTAMLKGTPLRFAFKAVHVIAIERVVASRPWRYSAYPLPVDGSRQRRYPEITITGTHLPGTAPVGVPLWTLTREDLDFRDIVTPQDLVRTLPQAFGGGPSQDTELGPEAATNLGRGTGLNLRGLGARGTLILLDGQRMAGAGTAANFVDLSNIPFAALERVDVLPHDTSAKYGADAIGGVVNLVLRHHFDGIELDGMVGAASGATLGERQVDFTIGTHRDYVDGVLVGEYYKRDDLPASSRALATSDLRAWGGNDFRIVNGNPGTIVASGQTWAVPRDQDGQHLRADQLVAGTVNLFDFRRTEDILPREQRVSLLGTLDVGWSDRLTSTVEALVADRRITSRYGGQTAALLVPSSNPYYVNPTGGTEPITVAYSFDKDFGPLISRADIQTANLGFNWRYAQPSEWAFTGSGTASLQRQWQKQTGAGDPAALAAALADSNPQTAFNPFGDGAHTSHATLAALSRASESRVDSYEGVLSLGMDGPVVKLPAGNLSGAFGIEWRRQSMSGSGLWSPGANPIIGDLERRILGAYSELKAPVSGANDCPGELNLSAALRYEHYSDVAGFLSSYAGLEWTPAEYIMLRGSVAQSFRAPDLPSRTDVGDFSEPVVLADRSSPTGYSSALYWGGGNVSLRPERARGWNIGLTMRPFSQQDLSIAMTYFRTRFADRIAQVPFSTDVLNDPSRQLIVVRGISAAARDAVCKYDRAQTSTNECGASGIGIIVDNRERNLATLLTDGVDFSGRFKSILPLGKLDFRVDGTYILEYAEAQTPASALMGLQGTEHNPLSLQLRASAGWDVTNFGITALMIHSSAYRDISSEPNRRVGSWTTVDGQIRYCPGSIGCSAPAGVQLSLSVQNAFDRQPPFLNNYLGIGYDQENADLSGRIVRFRVGLTW